MGRVYDHDMPAYRRRWQRAGDNRWNGAFYYSKEIVANIIPNVSTDRPWVTVNQRGCCEDGAIVFVHNNLHPEHYDWLSEYEDLVLICGVPETCQKVAHLGKAAYLPLSVDVGYVRQFECEKDKDACFVGRNSKRRGIWFSGDVKFLEGLPRARLLPELARYERAYAVGRSAIEAKVLGCEVLFYDPRYPDTSIWKVLDNKEAAEMLQEILDGFDR